MSAPIIGTTNLSNLEELLGKRARTLAVRVVTGLTRGHRRAGHQAFRGGGQVSGGAVQADGRRWGSLNVCNNAGMISGCEKHFVTLCAVLYC